MYSSQCADWCATSVVSQHTASALSYWAPAASSSSRSDTSRTIRPVGAARAAVGSCSASLYSHSVKVTAVSCCSALSGCVHVIWGVSLRYHGRDHETACANSSIQCRTHFRDCDTHGSVISRRCPSCLSSGHGMASHPHFPNDTRCSPACMLTCRSVSLCARTLIPKDTGISTDQSAPVRRRIIGAICWLCATCRI